MNLVTSSQQEWTAKTAPKKRILILEDMESISSSLKTAMEFHFPNCTVFLTESRQEAIDLLKRTKFTVVIADYGLLSYQCPKGENPLKGIYQSQPDIEIIVMSGMDERIVREHFGNDYSFAFFQKPFSMKTLFGYFQNLGWNTRH